MVEEHDEHERAKQKRPDLSSLIVCNAILSNVEQAEIAHAAHLANNGYLREAEMHRARAGYDSLVMRISPDRPVPQLSL